MKSIRSWGPVNMKRSSTEKHFSSMGGRIFITWWMGIWLECLKTKPKNTENFLSPSQPKEAMLLKILKGRERNFGISSSTRSLNKTTQIKSQLQSFWKHWSHCSEDQLKMMYIFQTQITLTHKYTNFQQIQHTSCFAVSLKQFCYSLLLVYKIFPL